MKSVDLNAGQRYVKQTLLDDIKLDLGALWDDLHEVHNQLNVDGGSGGNDHWVGRDGEGLEGQGLPGPLTETIFQGSNVEGLGGRQSQGCCDEDKSLHVEAQIYTECCGPHVSSYIGWREIRP